MINWPAAAIAAVVVALAVLGYERRHGTAWDGLVLQASAGGFFLIVAAIVLAAPHSVLRPYSGAGAPLWLAVIAWLTVASGKPFTMGIAKHGVPEQLWRRPSFLKANMNITRFWAAGCTVTGILIADWITDQPTAG